MNGFKDGISYSSTEKKVYRIKTDAPRTRSGKEEMRVDTKKKVCPIGYFVIMKE
jgi:hypothetical protein